MAAHGRMCLGGVVEHGRVGDDDGIYPQCGGGIDGTRPVGEASGLGIGVDRRQHPASALMGVANAFDEALLVEVEPGEVARVGVVAETQIDVVGTVIDGRLERRQAARRTHQLRFCGHSQPLKTRSPV